MAFLKLFYKKGDSVLVVRFSQFMVKIVLNFMMFAFYSDGQYVNLLFTELFACCLHN